MFFGRISPRSSDTKEAMFTSKKRRQLAALSLAVAMAAPVCVVGVSGLYGQEAAAPASIEEPVLTIQDQGNASSVELLKQALEEYKSGRYEEAQATLQQVKVEDLSEKNQKNHQKIAEAIERSAGQRREARAAFERGQVALNERRSAEALTEFRAAAANKYADQGTRQKALEQIALAENAEKQAAGERKRVYQQAVADYKAGNYESAQAKFEELRAAGFSAPLFQKSPEGYLKEIAAKTGAEQQQQPVAEMPKAEVQAEAPKVEAPAPAVTAQEDAKANAERQQAEAQAKAEADRERVDRAAVEAEAKQAARAEKEADAGRKAEAKRLYQLARDQYRKGDWIASRANFVAAQDLGYKAGLFEDSPATYLARMDKKEQADAAKAAREAEARAQREAEEQAQQKAQADANAVAQQQPAPPARPVAPTEPPAQTTPPQATAVAQAPAPATPETVTPAPATPTPPAPVEQQPATPTPPAGPETVTATDGARQDLEATAQLERIRQQQRAYEAQQLVERARAAQQEQRFADALADYNRAAELDPSNQQALQGQAEVQALTGRTPARSPLLQEQETRIETRRQAIRYSFDTAIDDAQAAVEAGDYRTARTRLQAARVAAESDPTIFNADEVRAFNSRVAQTANRLDAAEGRAAEAEQRRQADEALRQQQQRLEQEQRLRETTVANLIKAARRSIEENKYREAVGILDQILVIDPNNEYAQGVKPLVEDRAALLEQRTYREDFRRQLTKQLNSSEEKKIPYDDIFRYPVNWPDISVTRDASVEKERGGTQEDAIVRAQLERRLPEVRFDAIGFSDVIDFLRDVSGANIFVNWRALEAAGIDRNTPVTTRLRDVRFSKALETILRDVGGGTVELTYTVDDGVITISTTEDLSRNTVTRVYDIRDLIVDVPDFQGPQFDLQNASQQTTSGGGGGGGGQSIFGSQGSGQGGQNEQQLRTREERVAEITGLIQETVAPDSWREAGGTVGSVRELSGQLIVTQTPENQRQLQGLLEQLRETRAIQITIETRFLTVQRNYLEDIGFDVDFVFNNQNSLQTYQANPQDPFSLNRVPGTGQFTTIPVSNNSSVFTGSPQALQTNAPGSLNREFAANPPRGLTVAGTFLDDFQVNFLLRATQATRQATLLTAPRVTLFNGQRAFVLVSTTTAYVSDLQPVVGQAAVAFDPQISFVQSGAMLQVQATVSADRKYVTLTLEPTLQTLLALVDFTFQQSSPATVATGGGNVTNVSAGNGIVQAPTVQTTQVRTTVSVPDGGTLLLGGQTIAGEVELEAGVPVLSKIPFLKRLFTNRAMAKDEQVLLILVKPTIIIQRELEEKQFPLLSQKVGG